MKREIYHLAVSFVTPEERLLRFCSIQPESFRVACVKTGIFILYLPMWKYFEMLGKKKWLSALCFWCVVWSFFHFRRELGARYRPNLPPTQPRSLELKNQPFVFCRLSMSCVRRDMFVIAKKWFLAKPTTGTVCLVGAQSLVYFSQKDTYVAMSMWGYWKTNGSVCVVENSKGRSKICNVKKGDDVWNYATKEARETCVKQLCNLAKTGDWKNWFMKQKTARKTPWQREMPGHKSYGFQDAFKSKCWHGPKSYGDLIPDFEEFAKSFELISPAGTFNKKVCTGYYKPDELFHKSGWHWMIV